MTDNRENIVKALRELVGAIYRDCKGAEFYEGQYEQEIQELAEVLLQFEEGFKTNVMKEIGEIFKNADIEGDYWGTEEVWKPDCGQTIRSLGAQIIFRANEIEGGN